MSPADELRALLGRLDAGMAAEDANQPHVALAYDPEVGGAEGVGNVRGPYPSAADAWAGALSWCAELNAGNGPDDQPWLPGIARVWPAQ